MKSITSLRNVKWVVFGAVAAISMTVASSANADVKSKMLGSQFAPRSGHSVSAGAPVDGKSFATKKLSSRLSKKGSVNIGRTASSDSTRKVYIAKPHRSL